MEYLGLRTELSEHHSNHQQAHQVATERKDLLSASLTAALTT